MRVCDTPGCGKPSQVEINGVDYCAACDPIDYKKLAEREVEVDEEGNELFYCEDCGGKHANRRDCPEHW